MKYFVVAGFLLTSASRGPSAIAELLVSRCYDPPSYTQCLNCETVPILFWLYRNIRFAMKLTKTKPNILNK